ncbi:septal ring lytic transglycosylase RlpA family protein [Pusillimonas noertemannii]|uniref:Endolytic peptidoglycan transglycosylase RlpA n=1 Tax=Pusillimonas noertemannii TaxID=305977 RepID=A0A2U1CN66_9BURK|nr:septal ring lytic transglycosylase RlpA family protein [Pusillimonas noertemannii]NYT68524.1 septal ring lytic transglycosylase RlpA family protein [Pusillimonas noertemannii]PVY62459.1 rare lipoprotein A [Pusillimonas noertemannii]TFL10580.1 septal ring lytic transglycosylase RlpA family protein [Pusillimonas noertemannii]
MKQVRAFIVLASAALILAGCGSTGHKGGGYYKDDGPGSDIPANVRNTPDAVPRIESYAPANMRPYRVLGKTYVPLAADTPYRQTGVASWYGKKFHGNKTANGETYDMYAMTAAHPTLPLPSYARVTRTTTGASVVVRVNDRGPFHSSRIIDLSYAAAARLGLIGAGSGKVVVEAITNADIARAQSGQALASAGNAAPPMAEAASSEPTLAARLNQAAAEELDQAAASMPDALAVLDTQAALSSPNGMEQDGGILPLPTLQHSTDSSIYLQFGAFSGHDNAQALASQINRQIALVESRQAQITPSDNLYRVQIGPYANRTEAVNAALRIQQQTGARATVATRD